MNYIALWAVGGALAGLIAGSFIATLVIRWPAGRGLGGRSACDSCATSLKARDLVPLLSWVLAAGKCRACGTRINWRHPLIESLAVIIGATAFAFSPGAHGIATALFGWQLLALAALDAEHFWLPDRLTGLLAVTGLAAAVANPSIDLAEKVIGGTAGFSVLLAIAWIYRKIRGRDGIGGGDPKLFGAIGCWIGWQTLPYVLVLAGMLGLTGALIMMARGTDVSASTRLPLGTLMAIAAYPLALLMPHL